MKGDEETHPLLSPEDEFADFETWDVSNISGTAPKKTEMLQYEYARSALKLGLKLGDRSGVNPYKFGMIGRLRYPHRAVHDARRELLRQVPAHRAVAGASRR